jgi:hypothetical protein
VRRREGEEGREGGSSKPLEFEVFEDQIEDRGVGLRDLAAIHRAVVTESEERGKEKGERGEERRE